MVVNERVKRFITAWLLEANALQLKDTTPCKNGALKRSVHTKNENNKKAAAAAVAPAFGLLRKTWDAAAVFPAMTTQ